MSGAPRQTLPISWDRLHADCRLLSLRLREKPAFAAMIAVTRGGLVPAAIVARELSIRAVETVSVVSYRGETGQGETVQAAAAILKPIAPAYLEAAGAGLVVVDARVATGQTVRLLRQLLPRAHFACVYAKPAGRPLVDTVIADVSQETWIYFPWDLGLTYTTPIVAEPATSPA